MSWDAATWDMDLMAWYKALIHLRRNAPALIDGGFQVLQVEPDMLIFQRDAQDQFLLVVAYRGEGECPPGQVNVRAGGIPDGLEFEELFTHQRASVVGGQFQLPALRQGAQIWVSSVQA
jgi:glycosidase